MKMTGMKIKYIGVSLWIFGSLFMARHIALSDSHHILICISEYIIIPILAIMLIYNWLWGNQKGHFVHLFMLHIYMSWSIILNIINPNNIYAMGIAFAVLAVVIVTTLMLARKKFIDDYREGIKRDHFSCSVNHFR